jgi:aspartate/methionine/tyrosine aminotransferase
VAVAPGGAFGGVAGDAVRISLASSDQDLREGVGRLCELVGLLR